MANSIKIGILAGMGPRSTSPFLESVLDECQRQYGAVHDIDYPHIHIYALPTPFYPQRDLDDDAMRAALTEGIQGLCLAQVDYIVVPCNSAHPYFDTMQAHSNVPVLNMIDLTLSAMRPEAGPVGVVATRGTLKSGLYTRSLACSGFAYEAGESYQGMIDDMLALRKSQGVSEAVLAQWYDLRGLFLKAGVKQILIACTDLGFIAEHAGALTIIDSSQILAQETIKYYLELSEGKSFCVT